MADIASDDDPDSAAMAEAMGFTGFGMQRAANRKRKLTPPSQTGANSAPLGKRRPLNLPEPVSAGGGGNAEEIGLDDDDDDDDDGSGGDVGAQDGGGEAGGDIWAQPGLDALSVSDAPPATGPLQHQLPAKPPPQQQQQQQQQQRQNQNQTRHAGKASRHPGGGPGRAPWWEGEWDPRLVGRMVENPWERLEKQRGLEARGTWPHGGGGGGGGDAPAPAPAGGAGLAGGAVGSVGGGIEAAAQATTVS